MDDLMVAVTVAFFTVLIISKIWRVCVIYLWRPYALTRYFRKQGITGPSYSLVSGSLLEMRNMLVDARQKLMDTHSHDVTPRVLPYYHTWSLLYGETFLYWYGTEPRICVSEPELAKYILSTKFGFFPKPKIRPALQTLIGKGLVVINGLDWVNHRRILMPAFSMEKLKVMAERMAACTISMLDEWKTETMKAEDRSKTIEISEEFIELTANIIAHTSFGTSFVQGREVFNSQRELQRHCVASNANVFIAGTRYIPTPSNLKMWKLDRKIKKSLKRIIESRLNSESYGDDLLGVMIEASETKSGPKLSMKEIIEECKTFFFAGHETTSNLLTWTSFLLSSHKEWQEKLREEVLQNCGTQVPDADALSKLKMMNMVLLEALRLYSPVIVVVREAAQDMKVGNLRIPKGTCLTIPIVKIHSCKEYWGEDAKEFNPMRFVNGVSKAAKHPNALIAFGFGPRICIGQNFAMLEAKMAMALILQSFSLSLSPHYKHAPANNITMQPQYGLPIILKLLHM